MPDRPVLAAEPRSVTGKAVAALRRSGKLPAVVYGHGRDSQALQLDAHSFDELRRHTGATRLVDLEVEGDAPLPVLVHNVQFHPVTRRPLHVDLFAVRMTEELVVDVPVVTSGVSEAVDVHGGTLLLMTETLKVRALPTNLPESIPAPIDGLADFDATLHVRDLVIPANVTVLNDPDELVARVQAPRIEIEAAPAEVEEAAEAPEAEAEGEAASPAAEAGEEG